MKIHQIFFKNALRNFCYLLTFEDGFTYCIDPFRSDEVSHFLLKQNLTAIINTHDHCDHFSGNENLVKQYNCTVMAHSEAVVPLKNKNLADHEIIHQNEDWTFKSLHTPGHTMSHICLLVEKKGTPYALFTGDCFFNAGVGNCYNGGNPEALYETITNIFGKFPDELLIYPGHEYLKRNLEFTRHYEPENQKAEEFFKKIEGINLDEVFYINSMKTERQINTFLRLESPDLREHLNLKQAEAKKVFLTLRELRNRW